MSLKVIGAGQPRTGTLTLKTALEQLGYGPCYHMLTLIEEHPEDIGHFSAARDGADPHWQTLFERYRSAVDFPASLYYESIAKEFPDAKIILTVRDPEKWFESISKTVFKASQPGFFAMCKTLLRLPFNTDLRKRIPVFAFAGRMIRSVYGPNLADKKAVIETFNAWNEAVVRTVPRDRLLVFDVKAGWEPLCAFLGVPVPRVEFPKTNTTEDFLSRAKRM